MYATDTLMDEREVVLRLIDGDEEAFCELYAAYKNRLLEDWEELPPVFYTSSEKKQGRTELLDYIGSINDSLENS